MPTTLITGANRGIGLEFARQYAAEDWTVIATCRNPIGLGELATIPGDVQVHGLDVSEFTQLQRLAEDLRGTAIDLLINNAGIYGDRKTGFRDLDYDDWMKSFRVNAMAPVKVVDCFIDHVAASSQKKIANLSSVLASIEESAPNSASYAYRTSKAALNMAMHVLAMEVQDRGVTSILLHPGWVKTDMGGADAAIDAETSVTGLRKVIDGAALSDSGKFFAYDGRVIPW